ncbi:MAG TPA: PrsW family glutamic-type intramembrane protease [Candidatus Acidoferrum sp.]|nr:PrsW family glutamic-type intramembrane protease [Candidatus Acidoferrum sp.]
MSRVRIVVATEVILFLGLLAFVAGTFLFERAAGLDGPVSLGPVVRVAFAAAPSALWLGYFRSRDSQEPEPMTLLLVMYLAGALVAGPVATFAVDLALAPDVAAGPVFERFGGERLVTAFLIVAAGQEFCKYAIVRYTVYVLPALRNPIDGMVYTTAVGLGFATFRAHRYLSELDGQVVLSTAAARVVVTTLAHACFAAVLGLAIGWAKFSSRTGWRRSLLLLGGLVGAIALNGQFALSEAAISVPGLGFAPWRSVAFAFGFSAAVLIGFSFVLRRILRAMAQVGGEA